MYFNRDTGAGAGAGGMKQSQSYYSNMQVGVESQLWNEMTSCFPPQAPDMDDVKESVKQGVTKVAGRLSGMASGVMSSIQVSQPLYIKTI